MVWEDHILGGHRRVEAAGQETRRFKLVMRIYGYDECTGWLDEQPKEL